MLIRFTVENYLSFGKRTEFNMIASQNGGSKQHHIAVDDQNKESIPLLRSSIFYGANESGKSNLIKAMKFAKEFIVNGVDKNKNILLNKFKLNKEYQQKPSRFEFEFKCNDKQYAYGFVIDITGVQEEWLYEIGLNKEEKIYERNNEAYDINFKHELFKDIDKEEEKRIIYETKGTRNNLLFLTNTKERNIKLFTDIYYWFDEILNIIFPDSKPVSLTFTIMQSKEIFLKYLSFFNFTITDIDIQNTDIEKYPKIPDIENSNTDVIKTVDNENKDIVYYLIEDTLMRKDSNGKLEIIEYKTVRKDNNKNNVLFDPEEESDGTQRILEYIQMLISIAENDRVFIIDEIERSIHSNLIWKIFDCIFNNKNFANSKGQLIASSHEVQLLDINKLFRKDEIWFVEKNKSGESELYSLANTDVEGLDLINGYLSGRFGAIPFLQDAGQLGWDKIIDKDK